MNRIQSYIPEIDCLYGDIQKYSSCVRLLH